MSTKHIVSAQFATEGSYGSIAAATGEPDTSALTFYGAEISDKSTIIQPGEPLMVDRNAVARDGLYEMPPEAATIKNAGGWIKRRQGSFDITMPIRGQGDGTVYTDASTMPFWQLMETCLDISEVAAPADDTVVTAGSATSHTGTGVLANLGPIGQLIRSYKNGRTDYSAITDIATQVLTYSPAFISAVTAVDPDHIYPMRMAYIPQKNVPATAASVAIKLDGIGWTALAVGCKVNKVSFKYTKENGRLDATFSIDSAYISYTIGGAVATVPAVYADGAILHHLKGYTKISTTGGTVMAPVVAAAALASTAVCMDELTLDLEIVRSRVGCGESILGLSNMEAVDYKVAGSLLIADTTLLNDDIWNGTMRSIMIGFSSGLSSDPGEGGCIYLPMAVIKGDPEKKDFGMDHSRTKVDFGIGYFAGDDGTTAPANSLFRFGLGSNHS